VSWLVVSWDAAVDHYLQNRSQLTTEEQATAKLLAEELVRAFVAKHNFLSGEAVSAILRYIHFCLLSNGNIVDNSFWFCRSVIHAGGYSANEPEHVMTRFFTEAGDIIKTKYEGEGGKIVESETWHAYA